MTLDESTIKSLYEAFNAREIDRALRAMQPDVDWPNGWEGGRVHGREAVRDYWTRQWKALDPVVTRLESTPRKQDGLRWMYTPWFVIATESCWRMRRSSTSTRLNRA